MIIKHLFAKSQPINPIATTPSLPLLVPSEGGGVKKSSMSDNQEHG